jgi:hypothetical protein
MKLEFFDKFSVKDKIFFKEIHPVGAELFNADRQTDRQTDRHDEAKNLFSQICERV